jgi:SAM-dependent methyltransferase
MSAHISPYHAPGFIPEAISKGRHRAIIGGRWEETGRIQMQMLLAEGLRPHHRLLDIGCGPLRTGCLLVPYLDPGHYWGTDLSGALMHKGHAEELTAADRARLPLSQLVEDHDFAFPGIPPDIDHILSFAVFTHLPMNHLRRALLRIRGHFPRLEKLIFTVFLAPDAAASLGPVRQPDGVVTHDIRAPYHMLAQDVHHFCAGAGLRAEIRPDRLPRGQVLVVAQPL